jgi:hypothetical protein
VTQYEHISVLISIVIGLGLTDILSNVHELVQARDRVRVHWLPVTWAALIFVGLIQWWWSSFGFRDQEDWNFFYFLFLMLRPVTQYLSAAFVLPRVGQEGVCDMGAYYFRTRHWLFLLLAIGNGHDGVRRMLLGEALGDLAVWSNFVSAALIGSLAFSKSVRHHAAITILTVMLFLIFLLQAAVTLP